MFCQNNLLLDCSVVFQWRSVFGYLSWGTRRKDKKNKIERKVICLWYDNAQGYYFISKHYIQFFAVLSGEDHTWLFLLKFSSHPFLLSCDGNWIPYPSTYLCFIIIPSYYTQNVSTCLWMRTKLTKYNLRELWERHRKRKKKAQRYHEDNYKRRSLFLGNTC